MKDEGKFEHGTKIIKWLYGKFTYTGLLDANGKAFGDFEVVESNGNKYKGILKNDELKFSKCN